MKIEYMPWYSPETTLVRCSGDDGCGALLISGDTETHTKWHERIAKAIEAKPWTRTKGAW